MVQWLRRHDSSTGVTGLIGELRSPREKIDTLLVQREEAYRRIAALEAQVDEVMGGSGQFIFPEPPLPVAGFGGRPAVAPKKPASGPARNDKEPAEPSAEGSEKKPVVKKEE